MVALLLGVAAIIFQGFALVDALLSRKDAFEATSNQTKKIWLAILGVATAIGFVSLSGPLNMFNLLAVVAAGVYLTRVRPDIKSITGGGNSYGW